MNDQASWEIALGRHIQVLQEFGSADTVGFYRYFLPSLALTVPEVEELEGEIGHRLPDPYRAFLLLAGGWRGFHKELDLFGRYDLVSENREGPTRELLDVAQDEGIIVASDVLCVGANKHSIDLIVLDIRGPVPGRTRWIAGMVIEEYASFDEYFQSITSLMRARLPEFKRMIAKNYG